MTLRKIEKEEGERRTKEEERERERGGGGSDQLPVRMVVMETEKVGQKRKSRASEQKRVERKKEKDRGPTGRKRVKERNEEKR